MDSRLIYASNHAIKNKVAWVKATPDSEWIFFGNTDNADKDLVSKIIYNHFPGDVLYVAFTRGGSLETNKRNIKAAIEGLLGFQSFFIWDENFKNAIEFNKIGTLRCGQLNR